MSRYGSSSAGGGGFGRRPPPDITSMTSLKVDNISYRTGPEELRRLFEKYGDIGDIHIPRDPRSRQSKGFAFVRFYNSRDAEEAMDRVDGRRIDGRELKVVMARYGRPADESSGGRRSGGRRGSRDRARRRSDSRSRSRSRGRERNRNDDSHRRSPSPSRSRTRSKSKDAEPTKNGRSPSGSKSKSRSASRD